MKESAEVCEGNRLTLFSFFRNIKTTINYLKLLSKINCL